MLCTRCGIGGDGKCPDSGNILVGEPIGFSDNDLNKMRQNGTKVQAAK